MPIPVEPAIEGAIGPATRWPHRCARAAAALAAAATGFVAVDQLGARVGTTWSNAMVGLFVDVFGVSFCWVLALAGFGGAAFGLAALAFTIDDLVRRPRWPWCFWLFVGAVVATWLSSSAPIGRGWPGFAVSLAALGGSALECWLRRLEGWRVATALQAAAVVCCALLLAGLEVAAGC